MSLKLLAEFFCLRAVCAANFRLMILVWHPSLVSREEREAANDHKSAVAWFTGLPGSGKSTTAHEVERRLFALGCQPYVLDGDNVRHGLSADLGFSSEHRSEHLHRHHNRPVARARNHSFDAAARSHGREGLT